MSTEPAVTEPEQPPADEVAPDTSGKIRVLVVDDARTNRQFVGDLILQRGLGDECVYAEDGLVAFKALRSAPIELVVCDLDMPRCDGVAPLGVRLP